MLITLRSVNTDSIALALVVIGAVFAPVALAATSTITYYHNDITGSPVAATNAAKQVVWRESYRPYGERTQLEGASVSNEIWFTSRKEDPRTELVYMGARWYDARTGRFMATDPVRFDQRNAQSFNRYAYANNNPYKYRDPDGRTAGLLALGVRALSGAAIAARVSSAAQDLLGPTVGLVAGCYLVGACSSAGADNPVGGSPGGSAAASGSPNPEGSPDPDDDDAKPDLVSNPKHHRNSSSPEPRNVRQLYENSVEDSSGVRWAKDSEGTIHRFSRPSNGETHWNGSTGGAEPIQSQNIPAGIRRTLGFKG